MICIDMLHENIRQKYLYISLNNISYDNQMVEVTAILLVKM